MDLYYAFVCFGYLSETKSDDNLRSFGKVLHYLVRLLVAAFIFFVVNFILDNLTNHLGLVRFNAFDLLRNGMRAFVCENLSLLTLALSVLSGTFVVLVSSVVFVLFMLLLLGVWFVQPFVGKTADYATRSRCVGVTCGARAVLFKLKVSYLS